MRIKATIEYEVNPVGYMILAVGNCPDGKYNDIILEQEDHALVNIILEKLNPGQNIQIKVEEI